MPFSRNLLVLLLMWLILPGCKHTKKLSLTGEEPVKISDFIAFFHPLKLPFQCNDSIFLQDDEDSLLISYTVFTQFVPDSVLGNVFGKTAEPDIYSMGRVDLPQSETLLFVKTSVDDKNALFLLGFDKKQQFMTALLVIGPGQQPSTLQSVSVDKKYTINKTILRKNPDASMSEGKDVYTLDKATKKFMLIMTDALDDKITELINPIDTLPRKNKFSADYGNSKMNLVSIRDGRRNDRLSFFVHFEKNNGVCSGELKGEAILRSASMAEYKMAGEPCSLQFNFSSSSVTLKEESCGSHRGMGCLFDGSFSRMQEVKKKKK